MPTPSSPKPATYAAWLPVDCESSPPALPLPPRRGVMRQRPGLVALDLGAPGLVSVTATLVTYGILVAPVLPLGIVGVASIGFDDWGLGLRIALGVLGIVTCLFCAGLVLWPFIFAAGWRERILITGDRITVEVGVGRWRSSRDLGALADVEASVVAVPTTIRRRVIYPNYMGRQDGRCLLLRNAKLDNEILVGTWLDRALVGMARDFVVRAERKAQTQLAGHQDETIGPLGWTTTRIRGAIARWVRAVVDSPAPLFFDLAITLGFLLLGAIPETFDAIRAAYPVLGVALFGGLAFHFRAPSAVLGLVPHARSLETSFLLAFGGLALVVGLGAGPMATAWFEHGKPRVDLVAVGVAVVLTSTAAVFVGKRALKTATSHESTLPTPGTARMASSIVTIALIGLTWVHESWAWGFIADAQKGLGPLSVAMTPVVAGLLIWPARFIYLLQAPFDDGPRWAFVWVMSSLVLFSLTGWA